MTACPAMFCIGKAMSDDATAPAVSQSTRAGEAAETLIRFGSTERYVLKRAVSGEDRLRCWNLVYREYVEMGYVRPQALAYRYTAHDALPETATFFVECEGQVAATVTLFPDTPMGLPADEAYRDVLDGLRGTGRRLVEVGRLTLASAFQHDRDILAQLFDVLSIASRRLLGGTDLLVTVNPSHAKFYERMLCFERIGEEAALGSVSGAPALLLRLAHERETALRRWVHGEGRAPKGFAGGRTLYPKLCDRAGEESLVAHIRRTNCQAAPSRSFLHHWFVATNPLIPLLDSRRQEYLRNRLGLAWSSEECARCETEYASRQIMQRARS